MTIGIYRIRNKVNGRCYVGSSKDVEKRFKVHQKSLIEGKHHSAYLQRAWKKYGEENFEYEILKIVDVTCDLHQLEQLYIDDNIGGYNVSLTASGGDNLTNNIRREEIIQKIAKTVKEKNSKLSKEERSKKYGHFGDTNPMFGKKRPGLGRGRKFSEQSRRKMSEAAIVRMRNPETRRKMSEHAKTRTGDKNPFFGKTHNEHTIEKIRQGNKGKKPPNRVKISVNGQIYASLADASRELNVPHTTVHWRVRSKNEKFKDWFIVLEDV